MKRGLERWFITEEYLRQIFEDQSSGPSTHDSSCRGFPIKPCNASSDPDRDRMAPWNLLAHQGLQPQI